MKAAPFLLIAAMFLIACGGRDIHTASSAVPVPGPRAMPADTGAPSRTEVVRALQALLNRRDPTFKFETINDVETVKDSLGRWWVSGAVVPLHSKRIYVAVAVKSHNNWKLVGWGTNIDTPEGVRNIRLPLGVAAQLFPETGNWAGYVVSGGHFTSITATWTQPRVVATGTGFNRIDLWVGLGGFNTLTLEQIGTSVDTLGNGSRGSLWSYGWYEAYPRPPVVSLRVRKAGGPVRLVIQPGDTIRAEVAYIRPHLLRFALTNESRGEFFSVSQELEASSFPSAEVIVEGLVQGKQRLLPAFSTVRFTACHVNGRPLATWHCTKAELQGTSGFFATCTSELDSGGSSFSVAHQ